MVIFIGIHGDVASGKRLQVANWKIIIFNFGKSTINQYHKLPEGEIDVSKVGEHHSNFTIRSMVDIPSGYLT